jgi:hypothetical protein
MKRLQWKEWLWRSRYYPSTKPRYFHPFVTLQRFAVKSNCNTVSTLAFVQEVFSEEKHALTVGVSQ